MSVRHCKSEHQDPYKTVHICRHCWLVCFDPSYQKHWNETPITPSQRIDSSKLGGQPKSPRFNASWIRSPHHGNRIIMVYRTGWYNGSLVRLSIMKEDLTPEANFTLSRLRTHPRATSGSEDPRIFLYRGDIHVSFTGIEMGVKGDTKGVVTNVLYAKLDDNFMVQKVYAPHYEFRQLWEKNWQFFEGLDTELYCIYSIRPHVVFQIQGSKIVNIHTTTSPLPWSGGHLRGGCPPVRMGDTSFVHWFHGIWELGPEWPVRRYNMGAYRFSAKPPFEILTMTPHPVAIANPATRPEDQYCDALFPGGAILEDNKWKIVAGVHDRWIESIELPADAHLSGVPLQVTTSEAKRPLACIHLGHVVEPKNCGCPRQQGRLCRKGKGTVQQAIECETCPDYTTQEEEDEEENERIELPVLQTEIVATVETTFVDEGKHPPLPFPEDPPEPEELEAEVIPDRIEIVGSGPSRIDQIDFGDKAPECDGRRFNPSMFWWRGQRCLAFRNGCLPSSICIAYLDLKLNVSSVKRLEIEHPLCISGAEDPRFFLFGGRPHLSITGVVVDGEVTTTSVLVVELDYQLNVKDVWEPQFSGRRPIEKNWLFFEHDRELYCVYSILPHRILKLQDRFAVEVASIDWTPAWGSILRGGAPPVRVNTEYWSFFHFVQAYPASKWFSYAAGLYTFSIKPPFHPLRMVPGPIWQSDREKVGLNVMSDKEVLYPCGVVRSGWITKKWDISAGHHDHDSLIGRFDQAELEKLLQPLYIPNHELLVMGDQDKLHV